MNIQLKKTIEVRDLMIESAQNLNDYFRLFSDLYINTLTEDFLSCGILYTPQIDECYKKTLEKSNHYFDIFWEYFNSLIDCIKVLKETDHEPFEPTPEEKATIKSSAGNLDLNNLDEDLLSILKKIPFFYDSQICNNSEFFKASQSLDDFIDSYDWYNDGIFDFYPIRDFPTTLEELICEYDSGSDKLKGSIEFYSFEDNFESFCDFLKEIFVFPVIKETIHEIDNLKLIISDYEEIKEKNFFYAFRDYSSKNQASEFIISSFKSILSHPLLNDLVEKESLLSSDAFSQKLFKYSYIGINSIIEAVVENILARYSQDDKLILAMKKLNVKDYEYGLSAIERKGLSLKVRVIEKMNFINYKLMNEIRGINKRRNSVHLYAALDTEQYDFTQEDVLYAIKVLNELHSQLENVK